MIKYLDFCTSTQSELIELIKSKSVKPPFGLVAKYQSNGIGSRGNCWQSDEGNLYFSFAISESDLSPDLPPASLSIYFSCLMMLALRDKGSKIWVKWPNDFYLNDKKIGGTITSKISDCYICGIGLNLKKCPENSDILDIKMQPREIVEEFIMNLKKQIKWKQIFSIFSLEFQKSKSYSSHFKNEKISLENAILCEDGSILIDEKKVYSLR